VVQDIDVDVVNREIDEDVQRLHGSRLLDYFPIEGQAIRIEEAQSSPEVFSQDLGKDLVQQDPVTVSLVQEDVFSIAYQRAERVYFVAI
jgi:hypothetical protein